MVCTEASKEKSREDLKEPVTLGDREEGEDAFHVEIQLPLCLHRHLLQPKSCQDEGGNNILPIPFYSTSKSIIQPGKWEPFGWSLRGQQRAELPHGPLGWAQAPESR